MPTYINDSNYMQMNRLPRNGLRSGSANLDPSHFSVQDLDCKQILQHIQNCPVCQHVFSLKTPPKSTSFQTPFMTSTNKIEIPITTLIVFAVFIAIFFIYIFKTSRNKYF